MMHKWSFYCNDNGGKKQMLIVSAKDKTDAIKKGFERAKKNARGDITSLECRLRLTYK